MILEKHHGEFGFQFQGIGTGVHGTFEVKKAGEHLVGRKCFHPNVSVEKILQERLATQSAHVLILEGKRRSILPEWIDPISIDDTIGDGVNFLGKEVFDGLSIRQVWEDILGYVTLYDNYQTFLLSGMTREEFSDMYEVPDWEMNIFAWYFKFERELTSKLEGLGIKVFDLAPKNILLCARTIPDFSEAVISGKPFQPNDTHRICPNCDAHDWMIDEEKVRSVFGEIPSLQVQKIDQD